MELIRERLGESVGEAVAPLIKNTSHARGARTFHPDGLVFRARVSPSHDGTPELFSVAKKLEGFALVRLSTALWKNGGNRPDVLGMGVRFRSVASLEASVLPGDQDLLFATIISPVTMPFSPFTTNVRDFSRNHYWAVSPFDMPGVGRVKLRITSLAKRLADSGTREERLREQVRRNDSRWLLEARPTFTVGYEPLATLSLVEEVRVDQAALHLSPFNTGKGIEPRGFVHALRKAIYPASQAGRPATEPVAE